MKQHLITIFILYATSLSLSVASAPYDNRGHTRSSERSHLSDNTHRNSRQTNKIRNKSSRYQPRQRNNLAQSHRRNQERAQPREQQGISRQQAHNLAKRQHPGRVLNIKRRGDTYQVKTLNNSGEVHVVDIDAYNGNTITRP